MTKEKSRISKFKKVFGVENIKHQSFKMSHGKPKFYWDGNSMSEIFVITYNNHNFVMEVQVGGRPSYVLWDGEHIKYWAGNQQRMIEYILSLFKEVKPE